MLEFCLNIYQKTQGVFTYITIFISIYIGAIAQNAENPDSTNCSSLSKPTADDLLNVTDAGSTTSHGSRKVDVSKISRLLDHLTYDDEGLCEYDDVGGTYDADDVCFYPVSSSPKASSCIGL